MRTSLTRTLSMGILAVAAGGLLVACGSDDSTVEGSPSTSSTTTAAESTSAEETTSAESSSAAPTSPGQAQTAPPEQPQPVPEGFPGPTETQVDERGRAFLDELERNGVTPAGNGEIALSTATYICSAESQGVPADEISTFVTANVGVEASAAGNQITPEQAGETAQVYIAAAQNTLCNG